MKASKFTLGAVVMVFLSVSGWASDKMKANIEIDQTVHLGSTPLAAGSYKVTWTESGSDTEVTFSQGKKVIATAPAHVTHERSGYSVPALVINNNSNTLNEVQLPKVSLSFTSENAVSGKSGN